MRLFNSVVMRYIATLLLLVFVTEMLSPLVAFAQTGSAPQAEAASASISSTQMVDPFTGQFTYSIPLLSVPGPHGSGYPIALTYNSNVSPQMDASWVGYGWNLNLGAITRMKRGIADDMDNENVTTYNKLDDIKSWSSTARLGLQVRDKNKDGDYNVSLGSGSGSATVTYNNYIGWGLSYGLYANAYGMIDASVNIDRLYDNSFSLGLYPITILQFLMGGADQKDKSLNVPLGGMSSFNGYYNAYRMGYTFRSDIPYRAVNLQEYQGFHETYMFGVQVSPRWHIGGSVGLTGSYSRLEMKSLPLNSYGYMYVDDVQNYEDNMDYFVEKDKSIRTKKQPFLPIPYSAPDLFYVSSAGQQGTFRLFRTKTGSFRPPKRKAEVSMSTVGIELVIGGEIGISSRLNMGEKRTEYSDWSKTSRENIYSFEENREERLTNKPYKFLFLNDPAASIQNSYDDNPISYDINSDDGLNTSQLYKYANRNSVINSSKNISFNTIRDMMVTTGKGVGGCVSKRAMAWNNNTNSISEQFGATFASGDRFDNTLKKKQNVWEKSIGEFAITNADGSKYIYGIPVYSRNEQSLAIPTFQNRKKDGSWIWFNDVPSTNPYKVKAPLPSEPDELSKVVGEVHSQPYATSFLLTEILSPDYVDVTGDGPTTDDLGGYTLFKYEKCYGNRGETTDPQSARPTKTTDKTWYKWREPYLGFNYSRNKLSTPRDDMATVQTGEKEIYYVSSIETKTHIAVFVNNLTPDLGSNTYRKDCFPSSLPFVSESQMANNAINYVPTANRPDNNLRILEEIRLYAKSNYDINNIGATTTLIKKVRFAYNYDLMKNQPNSLSFNPLDGEGSFGKLTLKQIWYESGGVHNRLIAPYIFDYEYPSAGGIPDQFETPFFTNYLYGTSLEENPPYNDAITDRWGKYHENGPAKYGKQNHWVSQTNSATFDPAAWHLKAITLPTGGRIFIQYEQHEYEYVQNQPALMMAELLPNSQDDGLVNITSRSFESIIDGENVLNSSITNDYQIDLAPLGLTTGQKYNLAQEILLRYGNDAVSPPEGLSRRNEKIFFKYLYKFGASGTSQLSSGQFPQHCNYEYISGYTTVRACTVDGNTLHIVLGKSGNVKDKPIYGAFGYMRSYNIAGVTQPQDEYKVRYTYDHPDNSLRYESTQWDDDDGITFIRHINKKIFGYFPDNAIVGCTAGNIPTLMKANSYLRIPCIKPKKGGGVRVKRLLMMNPSGSLEKFTGGDEAIYGTEYRYETGVATTEPTFGREENAIVRPLEGSEGDLPDEIIAGDDLIHFEGPLGESLLPSPSIGYKKVIVSNIYANANQGYTIYNFNTCKDFPSIDVEKTPLNYNDDRLGFANVLLELFTGATNEHLKCSQGYTFKLNNMHGTMESIQHCIGVYDPTIGVKPRVADQTEFEYYKSGEAVPVMYGLDKPLRMRKLGKQSDLTMESRALKDEMNDYLPEFSITLLFFGIDISLYPSFTYHSAEIYTHAISKVITNPVLLRKVITTHNGIISVTENVAFDPATGAPVITKTYDSYNMAGQGRTGAANPDIAGLYYSYQLPANLPYPGMSTKSPSEGYVIHPDNGLSVSYTSSTIYSGCPFELTISRALPSPANDEFTFIDKILEVGDIIRIYSGSVNDVVIHKIVHKDVNILGKDIKLYLSDIYPSSCSTTNHYKLPTTGVNKTYVEIIKSNKDNHLGVPAHSVVTRVAQFDAYGNTPVDDAVEYAKYLYKLEWNVERLNALLEYPLPAEFHSLTSLSHLYTPLDPDSKVTPTQPIFPFNFTGVPTDVDIVCQTNTEISIQRGTDGTFQEAHRQWLIPGIVPAPISVSVSAAPNAQYRVNDDGKVVISSVHPDVPYFPDAVTSNFKFKTASNCSGDAGNYIPAVSRTDAFPTVLKESIVSISAQNFEIYSENSELTKPAGSYIYQKDNTYTTPPPIQPRDYSTAPNYTNQGVFSIEELFQFASGGSSVGTDQNYLKTSSIRKYSLHGEPLVAHNYINKISSVTGYSHNAMLPGFSASLLNNVSMTADQLEHLFYYNSFEASLGVGNSGGHSGQNYLAVTSSGTSVSTTIDPIVGSAITQKMIIEFWAASTSADQPSPVPVLNVSGGSLPTLITSIPTGRWTKFKYESTVSSALDLSFSPNLGTNYYVDDIRIYPVSSESNQFYTEMTCNAYDAKTLRLVAQFDRDHFGTYFQYNGEGQMVRTIVETDRGYKTVQEAHPHIPSAVYNTSGSAYVTASHTQTPQQMILRPSTPKDNGMRSGRPSGVMERNSKFDVLNLNITPEKKKVKLFGVDADSISSKMLEDAKKKLPSSSDIPDVQPKISVPRLDTESVHRIRALKDTVMRDSSKFRLNGAPDLRKR